MINIECFTPEKYFGSNTYLLQVNDEYAVIDPSVDYEIISKSHPEIDGKIKYILLTHCHFDHILKIKSWADTGAEVIVGSEDKFGLSSSYLNCYLGFLGLNDGYFGFSTSVNDGDILHLDGEKIRVISTPGHTPGGVCYRIGNNIFVGDTVFADGGYGRCDLPGGDIDALEKSIIKLITVEQDALLYPGHGPKTTLKELIVSFM